MANIENKSEKLYQILIKDLISKWYEKNDIEIRKIDNDLYAVWNKKNIWFFCHENGKPIFNLKAVWEAHYFNKALFLAWYREIRDINWVYNLYSLNNINLSTWNPNFWAKPIDKYSLKYFQIWKDIIFHEDKLWLETMKITDTKWNLHKTWNWQLEWYIDSWVLRIKDVYALFKQKQIDKNTFDKHLPSLQKILLSQIWDTRFEALWDYVTEKEIKDYLEGGYISRELARECYKKIKERDSIKTKKEKKKQEIHSRVHFEVSDIQVG